MRHPKNLAGPLFTLTSALLTGALLASITAMPRMARAASSGELMEFDGPEGGHLVGSLLPGKSITSAKAAFQAGVSKLHGQFESPRLLGGVGSKDGKTIIAPFRARRNGAPVAGLIIATYSPSGSSHFAVLFDDPKSLKRSLKPMIATLDSLTKDALEKSRPQGGASSSGPDFAAYEAASHRVSLTRTAFPDGTATIGVAPGFTPLKMAGGTFVAKADDGAYENLYLYVGILDPNGSNVRTMMQISGGQMPNIPGQTILAYNPDPIVAWKNLMTMQSQARGEADPSPQITRSAVLPGAWQARMVQGTFTLHGEEYVFSGALRLSPPPSPEGGWGLQVTIRGAPAAHADRDMPALIAMHNSEKMDMRAIEQQTNRFIAASQASLAQWSRESHATAMTEMQRRFELSMHDAQVAQDNIDRSSAGFIHYINGTDVLEHTSTGAAGTVNANVAGFIAHDDPEHFRVVPVNEYVKGRDFGM